MASQSFIIEQESALIHGRSVVDRTLEALHIETQIYGGTTNFDNRDCWGTLKLNTEVLRNRLDTLIEILDKAHR